MSTLILIWFALKRLWINYLLNALIKADFSGRIGEIGGNRRSQNPAYIYRQKRVYIQHVEIRRVRRRWKINAAWLERNYYEQYFRRCFEEKEIFRKSYAEAQEIMRRFFLVVIIPKSSDLLPAEPRLTSHARSAWWL